MRTSKYMIDEAVLLSGSLFFVVEEPGNFYQCYTTPPFVMCISNNVEYDNHLSLLRLLELAAYL